MKAFKQYITSKLFIVALVLLSGCEYEAPLSAEQNLAIDPLVLGEWEPVVDEDKASQENERLVILPYAESEYLIHYPPGGRDEAYYRAYPIKLGDWSLVQLQIIGTPKGPLKQVSKELYHVVAYQLQDGELEVRTLNTDVLDDSLKTTKELAQAFLKNSKNKTLFNEAAKFRKITR